MKKLEIYNLANASHWMDQTDDGYPYIESLCNQRDPVSVGDNTQRLIDRVLYFSQPMYTHSQEATNKIITTTIISHIIHQHLTYIVGTFSCIGSDTVRLGKRPLG